MDGWTDGRMDGWMDGRTDGWTDGWIDGWIYIYICLWRVETTIYSGRGGSTTNQMIIGPGFLRSSLLQQLWVIMASGPGGFVLNPWMHRTKTRYVLGDGQRRWNERSTVYFAFHRLSVAPGAFGLPKPLGICGHDKPCRCYLQPCFEHWGKINYQEKDRSGDQRMTSSQENASVYVGFFYGQYIYVYIYIFMYIDISCSMSCILL